MGDYFSEPYSVQLSFFFTYFVFYSFPFLLICVLFSVSFLGKSEKHPCIKHPAVSNCQSDENTETQHSWKCALNADYEPTSNVEMAVGTSHFSLHQRLSDSVLKAQCTASSLSDNSDVLKENEDMVLSKFRKDQSLYRSSTAVMKKARRSTSSQLTLKAFFKQPKAANSFDTANTKAPQVQADWQDENENMFHKTESSCDKRLPENIEENSSELTVPITDACGQDLSFSSKMEKGNAVLEWQKIQEKMRTSIPLCKGHHEPCVARSVKKGSNVGRRFYVCARAKVIDLSDCFMTCLFIVIFVCYHIAYYSKYCL